MKIDHIKVSRFNVVEVVKEINKRAEGRNLIGVFFNQESLLNGTLEIRTTPIRTHVVKEPCTKVSKKSKYRGVCWDKGLQKWRTRIMVNGKRISLGLYDDEIEAAKVYDLQAMKSLGEKAKTNFEWKLEEFYCDTGFYEKYYVIKGDK